MTHNNILKKKMKYTFFVNKKRRRWLSSEPWLVSLDLAIQNKTEKQIYNV